MAQVLEVKVPIQIPKDYRLIKNSEYEELQKSELSGRAWGMGDLRKRLDRKSPDWIKENILFSPKFHKEIAEMEKEHLIIRPRGRGGSWKFKATAMSKFLEDHCQEFNW